MGVQSEQAYGDVVKMNIKRTVTEYVLLQNKQLCFSCKTKTAAKQKQLLHSEDEKKKTCWMTKTVSCQGELLMKQIMDLI